MTNVSSLHFLSIMPAMTILSYGIPVPVPSKAKEFSSLLEMTTLLDEIASPFQGSQ